MKNKNKAKQETIDVSDMPEQVLYKSEKKKMNISEGVDTTDERLRGV